MAAESDVIISKQIDNTHEVVRPDFSGFDTTVLNWTLTSSNTIDTEDNMAITLTGIPKYNGGDIEEAMEIILPVEGVGDINMIVRSLDYQLTPSSSTTSLLLGTRAIKLKTARAKGIIIPDKQGVKLADVFDAICSGVGIKCTPDIDDELFTIDKLSIGGNQDIFDFLHNTLQPGGVDAIMWWFDPFNTLHAHVPSGINQTPIDIDFNDIKCFMTSFNIEIIDREKSRHVIQQTKLNEPNKDEPFEQTVAEYTGSLGSNVVTGKHKKIKDVKRAAVAAALELQQSGLKKAAIKPKTASITLVGLYWAHAHSKVRLVGFPAGNDDNYVLKSVILSDQRIPSTTLMFEAIDSTMPEKTKGAADESEDKGALFGLYKGPLNKNEVVRKGEVRVK